jgi:hypothetical protein
MTRYLKLTREDGIEINFAWGSEVGAWTNRNPESIRIGKEIVQLGQARTLHNRRWMKFPRNWKKTIFEMVEKHNLHLTEDVVLDGEI